MYDMGNDSYPSYVSLKGNTYYLKRHAPLDIQPHNKSNRLMVCLKTNRHNLANRSAKSIAKQLEDNWLSLRLAKIDIPNLHLASDK